MFRTTCLMMGLIFILQSPVVTLCFADDSGTIVGTYECLGKNSDGSNYRGTVTIKATEGSKESFILKWNVGGSEYIGIGLLDGQKLSSSWAISTTQGVAVGIIVYDVDGNTLKGRWTSYPGKGGVLTETLTRR